MRLEYKYYKMHDIANTDKAQTKLTPQGIEQNTSYTKKEIYINLEDKTVFCPFCLHKTKLTKYFISTKKGYNKLLGKCPECNQQMQLKTLINLLNWTATEYAEFVYQYGWQFWNKCKFDKWKERLYQMNMSYEFWNKYKQLKSEYKQETQDTEENYNAFLERQQMREQYAEQTN